MTGEEGDILLLTLSNVSYLQLTRGLVTVELKITFVETCIGIQITMHMKLLSNYVALLSLFMLLELVQSSSIPLFKGDGDFSHWMMYSMFQVAGTYSLKHNFSDYLKNSTMVGTCGETLTVVIM